jgi:hypothetical protein
MVDVIFDVQVDVEVDISGVVEGVYGIAVDVVIGAVVDVIIGTVVDVVIGIDVAFDFVPELGAVVVLDVIVIWNPILIIERSTLFHDWRKRETDIWV